MQAAPGPWRACPNICFIWVVTGEEATPTHCSVIFFSLCQRQKTYMDNSPLLMWSPGIPRLRQTLRRKIRREKTGPGSLAPP